MARRSNDSPWANGIPGMPRVSTGCYGLLTKQDKGCEMISVSVYAEVRVATRADIRLQRGFMPGCQLNIPLSGIPASHDQSLPTHQDETAMPITLLRALDVCISQRNALSTLNVNPDGGSIGAVPEAHDLPRRERAA